MSHDKIIQSLRQHRIQSDRRPYVIGIAGGTGSGKSTLAKHFCDRWSDLRVEVLVQDKFFKPPAEMPHYYSNINKDFRPSYNEPHSYEQRSMFSACQNLARTDSDIFIIEGITVLWFEELRDLMDLKIYVEVEADERIIRRIRRNMKNIEDFDKIVDYYLESVRWQHERYNRPTKRHADFIIPGGMAEKDQRENFIDNLCFKVSQYFNT